MRILCRDSNFLLCVIMSISSVPRFLEMTISPVYKLGGKNFIFEKKIQNRMNSFVVINSPGKSVISDASQWQKTTLGRPSMVRIKKSDVFVIMRTAVKRRFRVNFLRPLYGLSTTGRDGKSSIDELRVFCGLFCIFFWKIICVLSQKNKIKCLIFETLGSGFFLCKRLTRDFRFTAVLQLLLLQPGVVKAESDPPSLKSLVMDPYIIIAAGKSVFYLPCI